MHLLDSLTKNFKAAGAVYRAPQNLFELRQQLRDACQSRHIPVDLAFYCNWYSDYVTRLHTQENASMSRTRGQARKLWAEQSLIYQDIIANLSGIAKVLPGCHWKRIEASTEALFDLTDELQDAISDMRQWIQSEELRCLQCGWNGSSGHCPHCHVHVLKPVRRYSQQINHYVSLGPLQQRLFDGLMQVLEGKRDLAALRAPLQALDSHYRQCQSRSPRVIEGSPVEVVALAIEQGVEALAEMSRVFEDCDAQHLEDGWAMFFQAERGMDQIRAMGPSPEGAVAAAYDLITLSTEGAA